MPTYRRIEVGTYDIPAEAISLIEDIQALEQILRLLETLRDTSFIVPASDHIEAKNEANRMLRRVGFLLSTMQEIAQDRLRHHFLSGQRRIKRKHRREQTLADAWKVLNEGEKKD